MTPQVQLECFTFIVDNGENKVSWDFKDSWFCTCEDFYYRKHECKHIRTVKQELRTQINQALFDDSNCYNKLSTTKQSMLVGI